MAAVQACHPSITGFPADPQARQGREWIYLYLLIEFESRSQRFMVVRLMSYVGLLPEALSQFPEYRRRGA
ncbi:MAG: hypothetical protein GY856_04890, partial [bacterium]|nr:hypothetical protein [bacterium]